MKRPGRRFPIRKLARPSWLPRSLWPVDRARTEPAAWRSWLEALTTARRPGGPPRPTRHGGTSGVGDAGVPGEAGGSPQLAGPGHPPGAEGQDRPEAQDRPEEVSGPGGEVRAGDPYRTEAGSAGMPPWLPRAYVLAALTVVGFVLGWWLLGRLRDLIGLLLLAQFLAFALEPAVNWLARRGWRRGLATGVTMLVTLSVLVVFMVAVGSLVVSQVVTLADRLPEYLEETVAWANDTFDAEISISDVEQQVLRPDGPIRAWAESVATDAVDLSTSAFLVIFQLLTVLLFAYYLCADAPRVRRTLCSVLPPARQLAVMRAWEIAVQKTGGYLYSRLLLALVSSLAHWVVLTVLDVPYAVALAVWIGLISQLIPTVGTYLAAALPLLVALVADPVDALVLLIFVVIYQQVENYLLQPRITAQTLDMHPAVAFGAVIAGAAVLGPIGAVLAIPFTAITQTFVGSYIRRYEVTHHPLHETDPPGGPNDRHDPVR